MKVTYNYVPQSGFDKEHVSAKNISLQLVC